VTTLYWLLASNVVCVLYVLYLHVENRSLALYAAMTRAALIQLSVKHYGREETEKMLNGQV
jgi:hypothetical protein